MRREEGVGDKMSDLGGGGMRRWHECQGTVNHGPLVNRVCLSVCLSVSPHKSAERVVCSLRCCFVTPATLADNELHMALVVNSFIPFSRPLRPEAEFICLPPN